jgi:choice-of-anchor B domain-containing protein
MARYLSLGICAFLAGALGSSVAVEPLSADSQRWQRPVDRFSVTNRPRAVPEALSDNIEVLAVLPPLPDGSPGDVWGVGDLAVLAERARGWSLVDVTDPRMPFRRSSTGGLFTQDVKAAGTLLAATNEAPEVGAGVALYDISDPAAPVELSRIGSGLATSVHNVFLDGGFLYASSNSTGRVEIFDVRTPTIPVHVASVEKTGGRIHDAVVVDGRLYSSFLGGGFTVHDVSNPAVPRELVSHDYPDAFTHSAWPSAGGRFLFTTDEVPGGHMRVFDLVTPDGGGPVRQVGRFIASQPAIIHNVHTRGDLVFASYYTAGMRVIDVSTPRLPVEVGFIDTFPGASQTFQGAWGVYPYDPAGRIFISDQQTGLWIVRFDGRIAAAPTGIEVRAALERTALFARAVFDLTWDAHPLAVGYNIYRAEPGGPFTRINDEEPHTSTRFLESLEGAGSQEYAVSAVLADGTESRPSRIVLAEASR